MRTGRGYINIINIILEIDCVVTVRFESGRAVQVFLEYWGMSVTLLAPARDRGHSR